MKNLVAIADKHGGKNIALIRAAALQKLTGAKLTLLGFCYANINHLEDTELAKLSRRQLENKLLSKLKQELEQLVTKLNLDSSAITIKTLWGKNISQAISAYCDKNPVDMVIKSANRSESFLYTSTDWQLIRECPTPVMITASKSWKKKPRIVAAVDFATKVKSKRQLNHEILEHAQALAKALGEEIHIAYALTIPQPLADMDLIDPRKYGKEKRQKLQSEIDSFCDQYGIDKEHLHIKQGAPEKVIPGIASKLKADVVITGTVGRKGVKGKLVGNTAEGILSRLHTDIIAIKP